MMFKRISVLGFALLPVFSAGVASAAVFASQEVAYVQGTVPGDDTQYNDPSAAVGMPQGITGASAGFPGVVSVFNPAFDTDQIVLIGVGGHLTLKFATPVKVGSGPAVGVYSNVGLTDSNYPSGDVATPPAPFGGGEAKVRVSVDGVHWVNLGMQTFDIPENYYTNAGPYDVAAPSDPSIAHFARPYAGGLDAFSGEDYSQVLTTLNGSAGGTWLNMSASDLTEFSYIKFTVPATAAAGSKLAISAVAVAHGHVGAAPAAELSQVAAAVPLPPAAWSAASVLAVLAVLQWRRRVLA